MIVCLCHRVSDHAIEREARAGCASFEALQDSLRVATGCGACMDCAREVYAAARQASESSAFSLARPMRTVQLQVAR
jgi:bacterioferritin-associated ferredoxin